MRLILRSERPPVSSLQLEIVPVPTLTWCWALLIEFDSLSAFWDSLLETVVVVLVDLAVVAVAAVVAVKLLAVVAARAFWLQGPKCS